MPRLRMLERLLSVPLESTAVLLRVDYNVPRSGDRILDATRLRESLPTLRELGERGARTVLLSHGGRPDGKPDPELSLRPVAAALSELLGAEVGFGDDCIGEKARQAVERTPAGGCSLLENLRFHAGETSNDEVFAAELASLARLYVNDAFGCSHRAHASIVGLPRRSDTAVSGRLLEKEVRAFDKLLASSERPFVAILGGAKIGGKIATIEALLGRVDTLLIGGGMANTFLAAKGYDLGASLVAREEIAVARRVLQRAEEGDTEVVLPEDVVVTDRLDGDASGRGIATRGIDDVTPEDLVVDLGPKSIERFEEVIAKARVLFWNGPVGVFEVPPFDEGCRRVARSVADSGAYSVVGGGETVAAVNQAGAARLIDHVSTGGGASLALVAGKVLPGIRVLEDSE